MQLSNRLFLFLLPVAIPIILYNVSPNLLYVGGVYLLLLFIVCAVDYTTNPLFTKIEVRREMNSKFSLGVENRVTLKVMNRSRYPLRFRLKDDFSRCVWICAAASRLPRCTFKRARYFVFAHPDAPGDFTNLRTFIYGVGAF